jgi:hypothetical protein
MLNVCDQGCGTLLSPPTARCRACRAGRRTYTPKGTRQVKRQPRLITLPLAPVSREEVTGS